MRTYELSLTSNYVADWTFEMAIRELIQNGIDQEAVNPSDKFLISYEDGKLFFTNPKSYLKVNTLLLGRSSKTHDNKTVGQFGEGYKIASLVLNRLGKTFIVHNRSKSQIWTSRFVNSRRWHDRILVFDVDDHEYEERGLMIEVGNVTEEEYESLSRTWLGFAKNYEHIDTSYGQILTDENQKNRIYVNGLYISCNAEMKYGYNFLPEYLKLERDRKSCDSWDAKLLTSKMIAEAYDNDRLDGSEVFEMIEEVSDDVSSVGYYSSEKMRAAYLEEFDKENEVENGDKPIPVETQSQYKAILASGGHPVYVLHNISNMLNDVREQRMKELTERLPRMSFHEKLRLWYESYSLYLPCEAREEFEKIMQEQE